MQQIISTIEKIIKNSKLIHTKALFFSEEKERIKSLAELSDVGRQSKIEETQSEIKTACKEIYKGITASVQMLQELIPEKVNHFDLDNKDFYNYLNLINSVKGNVGEQIKNSLLEKYSHNNTALSLIAKVFENYGDKMAVYDFEKAIINLSAVSQKLSEADTGLYFGATDLNTATVLKAIRDFQEVPELLHIVLTEEEPPTAE